MVLYRQYMVIYRPIYGDLPANIWCYNGQYMVLYRPIYGDLPANIWWSTDQDMVIEVTLKYVTLVSTKKSEQV